jgi:hypothetical protein
MFETASASRSKIKSTIEHIPQMRVGEIGETGSSTIGITMQKRGSEFTSEDLQRLIADLRSAFPAKITVSTNSRRDAADVTMEFFGPVQLSA